MGKWSGAERLSTCKFLSDLTANPEHLTVRAEVLDLA